MTAIGDVIFNSLVGLGVTSSLVIGGVHVLPQSHDATKDLFQIHAIQAERHGDTAHLRVNRSIHKPVEMKATVRVMEEGVSGWREYCLAEGPVIEYRPEAEMPDVVTLDWWTWGKCPTLPEGEAQIWTTWWPQRYGLAPVSTVVDVPSD